MQTDFQFVALPIEHFRHLFSMNDAELASLHARRMTVDEQPGFPCRVTLDDCAVGGAVLLVNHVSHDAGPYRASHAIFVSEGADAAEFRDAVPPALDRRVLSLRAFDRDGMMSAAMLAQAGEADDAIRSLLDDPAVDHVDAHNAVRGCFAARIERD